jgi:hypothetical protein
MKHFVEPFKAPISGGQICFWLQASRHQVTALTTTDVSGNTLMTSELKNPKKTKKNQKTPKNTKKNQKKTTKKNQKFKKKMRILIFPKKNESSTLFILTRAGEHYHGFWIVKCDTNYVMTGLFLYFHHRLLEKKLIWRMCLLVKLNFLKENIPSFLCFIDVQVTCIYAGTH